MNWLQAHPIQSAGIATVVLGALYLWKLNSALKKTPPEALAVSPDRWTDQEIRETYERVKSNPIAWAEHLPPKLNRRYIVTGGSGGVGGQIILQLLERGQSPESIRNVDFRAPDREDMLGGPAAQTDFTKTDITSVSSTSAAFSKPWPDSVAGLPLTVFHAAAVIIHYERRLATYDRVKGVNVDGTQNVMDAAKAAGADVFVYTSSASVGNLPVYYWGAPWRRWPQNYCQVIGESDFDRPLRPHGQFWGNYPHSKAVAERLVADANSPTFRTGIIRPGNGIYGSSKGDQLVGLCLRSGTFPTWTPNVMQNTVHGGHVSLGLLLFEAALAGSKELPLCAGRPFVITDGNPPVTFADIYRLVKTLSVTPIRVIHVQPIMMHLIAHTVEAFDVLSEFPGLSWLKPLGEIRLLQPSTVMATAHTIVSDAAAKKSVKEGGLGYKGVCTSIEGMAYQVFEWNNEHKGQVQGGEKSTVDTIAQTVKNVGTMPAAVKA